MDKAARTVHLQGRLNQTYSRHNYNRLTCRGGVPKGPCIMADVQATSYKGPLHWGDEMSVEAARSLAYFDMYTAWKGSRERFG